MGDFHKALALFAEVVADPKASIHDREQAAQWLAASVAKPAKVRAEAPAAAPVPTIKEIVDGLRKILASDASSPTAKETAKKLLDALVTRPSDDDEKDEAARARVVARTLADNPVDPSRSETTRDANFRTRQKLGRSRSSPP